MQSVESVSRLVANSFVSGIWEGVVLAAGVGICLRLVPRTTVAVRFAIWTAVFAVLAVLPLVHVYGLRAGGGGAGHAAVVRVDARWSFAIAALWLAVSLVRGVKLAMSAVRLRGIWKRAVVVEGYEEVLLRPASRDRALHFEGCGSAERDWVFLAADSGAGRVFYGVAGGGVWSRLCCMRRGICGGGMTG